MKGTDRPGSRRFILDFVGGELPYFVEDPKQVELVPTISGGMITSSFLVPNEVTRGFRAGIDVMVEPGKTEDVRAYLRAGDRALTETWTFPWSA